MPLRDDIDTLAPKQYTRSTNDAGDVTAIGATKTTTKTSQPERSHNLESSHELARGHSSDDDLTDLDHEEEEDEAYAEHPSEGPSVSAVTTDGVAPTHHQMHHPLASPSTPANAGPTQRTRKRVRQILTSEQSSILNAILAKTHFPSTSVREAAARQLGVSPRKVQVWFQNVRQKEKKRATMAAAASRSSEALKAAASTSSTNNMRSLVSSTTSSGGGSRATSGRQHVVPTAPTAYVEEQSPYGYRAAHSPGLRIDTLSVDGMRGSGLIMGGSSASSHPMIRSDGVMQPLTPQSLRMEASAAIPQSCSPAAGSGSLSFLQGELSPPMRIRDGRATAAATRRPSDPVLVTPPRGRLRSASDVTARQQWSGESISPGGFPLPRVTRVPVYRMARPLVHQLPPIDGGGTGAGGSSSGHRHSRSSLFGPQYSYARSPAPYWSPSASVSANATSTSTHSSSSPGLHQARSFGSFQSRIMAGSSYASATDHEMSSSYSSTPQGYSGHCPTPMQSPVGALPAHVALGFSRHPTVSSRQSQPQLRSPSVFASTGASPNSRGNRLHRVQSDYILLPPVGDVGPSMRSRASVFTSAHELSTSSSGSRISSWGSIISGGEPAIRNQGTQRGASPTRTHTHLSPTTASFASTDMDEDSPRTPELGGRSLSASTLYGDDEAGQGGRGKWTLRDENENIQQAQTSQGEGSSPSKDWLPNLATPKPANRTADATAPRPAMRANPWRVRGPPSQHQAPSGATGPQGLAESGRIEGRPWSPQSVSPLSTRLKGIMSDERDRRGSDSDGTTTPSKAALATGPWPKRPPLRHMGYEHEIRSMPSAIPSLNRSQARQRNRSQSLGEYTTTGDTEISSTIDQSTFESRPGRGSDDGDKDDESHIALPPIRSRGRQSIPGGMDETHDDHEQIRTPSAIHLPSIRNLNLGV